MKKLFSIFGMVLISLALHATVVTKNPDMSQFGPNGTATVSGGTITNAAAWNGAESWEWLEGISAYDQIVIALEDHAQTVLFKIIYSDESSMQVELPTGTNTEVINLDPAQNIVKGIQVLNWSSESGIDITITDLFFRGAIGIKKNVTIWSGTKTFDEFDWENRLLMAADNFADLHVGDILEVYYTTDAKTYHQFDVKTNYDNNYPSFAPVQVSLGGSNESGVLRFYIAESSDLSNIASQGGLYLNGKYITFTKVSVIKHEVLWTGEQEIGEWTNAFDIPASKLSDLQVGNILCFRISAIGTEASPRVTLAYGDLWNDFDPAVEYYFQGSDEVPLTVEFPISHQMKQQLDGNKLVIRGVNYTVTDIYVKEGTPTSTVSAYLNVSSAGMATYILPFNVPSLPDGVQAYELTNDGSEVIMATEVHALEADKPVLIVAAEGEYEFISEEGASDDISGKTDTYANGALIGTYFGINPIPVSAGVVNNYILQNGSEGVAFYQVTAANCSIPAYRAYLSCSYDAHNGANFAPRMRIVFHKDATTGVENLQGDQIPCTKVFKDGVLYIKYNGIMYNVQGQLCK